MGEKTNCRNCKTVISYRSKVCEACGCEKPLSKADQIKDGIILTAAGMVAILTIVLFFGTAFSYFHIFQ
ncbi:hypothetical protein PJ311_15720 [Bacillus sp. CLL-7-23]|uniref:Uncharacterized protein n=1 Tax=Bacillus changyiensis TaxID=3004103 RepID=A0ABT4X6W7_9BACI|nr:hypothetical protein [Bacillus changyiensis]MDA7028021.1 hypothetical protein [Bacillus changyiensis]